MPEVNLRLDDLEALAVHHALSTAVTLIDQVEADSGVLAEQSAILRASAAIQNAVEAGVDRATLHAQVDLAKERT
jgi:hypothetical protein